VGRLKFLCIGEPRLTTFTICSSLSLRCAKFAANFKFHNLFIFGPRGSHEGASVPTYTILSTPQTVQLSKRSSKFCSLFMGHLFPCFLFLVVSQTIIATAPARFFSQPPGDRAGRYTSRLLHSHLRGGSPVQAGEMRIRPQDPYRACAGAVIFNRQGLYLVGERLQGQNQWQFPQVLHRQSMCAKIEFKP
jgi:hypothetical protein